MADKKKGAIFRMEEKDGKLYRVMYFKNNKGGLTRSKFIREVKRKDKKRGRPTKDTRTTVNKKLILENRRQINNNTRSLSERSQAKVQPTRPVQPQQPTRPVQPQQRLRRAPKPAPVRKPAHKYVKPSGASQNIIDEWKSKIKRR